MRPGALLLAASLAANGVLGAFLLLRDRAPGSAPEPGPAAGDATGAAEPGTSPAVGAPSLRGSRGPETSPRQEPDAVPAPAKAAEALELVFRRGLNREPTAEDRTAYARYLADMATAAEARAVTVPETFVQGIITREAAAKAQAKKARELAEDIARHGAVALLRRLKEERGEPDFAFVGGKEFEGLFVRASRGSVVRMSSGTPLPNDLGDGDTVQYPPGAYAASVSSRWRGKPFPKDLTFEGYGMEKTLVTFDEFSDPEGPIVNLTFRDLTVDAGNDYLFDVRGDVPATIRFERCRIVRFDMGAGGSLCFGMDSLALWMTDSRIETGFGRSPSSGYVFRLSGPLLARLDGCALVGPNIGRGGGGSSILLRRCTLTNVSGADRGGPLRLEDCEVSVLTAEAKEAADRAKTRPLSDLNSEWKGVK